MAMSGYLTCDQDGNIKAAEQLSVINNNRVRLSLVYDLSLLDPDALDRLRNWPNAFLKIIGALNGGLGWNSGNYGFGSSGLPISAEPLHPTYPYSKITNSDFAFAWMLNNVGRLPISGGNMPNFNNGIYNTFTNPPPNYHNWINDALNGNNSPWRDRVLDYLKYRTPDPGYPGNGGVGQNQPSITPAPILTDFGVVDPNDLLRLMKDLAIMKTVERTCIVALRNDLFR